MKLGISMLDTDAEEFVEWANKNGHEAQLLIASISTVDGILISRSSMAMHKLVELTVQFKNARGSTWNKF